MLPQKNRIQRKNFPSYQRQAKRFFSPLFSGDSYPHQGGVQVSVVVSKKIAKKAVIRNKIRRRFYSAITHHIDNLKDVSIIIYPKPRTEEAPFSLLKSEIERILLELKLLK